MDWTNFALKRVIDVESFMAGPVPCPLAMTGFLKQFRQGGI